MTTTQNLHKAVSISEDGTDVAVEGQLFDLWNRVLIGKHVYEALEFLQETGELGLLFPEVQDMVGFGGRGSGHKDLWDHTKKVVMQSKAQPAIRWAALWHDTGKVETFSKETGKVSFHKHEYVSARRFKDAMRRTDLFPSDLRVRVHAIVKHLGLVEGYESEWTDSAVRRLYKELGDHFDDTALLAHADITTKHAWKREQHHQRLHELVQRVQTLRAQDAIVPPLPKGLGEEISRAFGIPPSKRIGDLKQALEANVSSGAILGHQDVVYYIDVLAKNKDSYGLG